MMWGDAPWCFMHRNTFFFFFFRWMNISASLQVFLLQGLTEHIPLAMLFKEKVITSLGSLRGNCALWRCLLVARGSQRSSPLGKRWAVCDIGSISTEVRGLDAGKSDYSPSSIDLLIRVKPQFLPSSGLPAAFPFPPLRRKC